MYYQTTEEFDEILTFLKIRLQHSKTHHLLNKPDLEDQECSVLRGRVVVLQTPPLQNDKSDFKGLSSLLFIKVAETWHLPAWGKTVWSVKEQNKAYFSANSEDRCSLTCPFVSSSWTAHGTFTEAREIWFYILYVNQGITAWPPEQKQGSHVKNTSRSYFNPKERKINVKHL